MKKAFTLVEILVSITLFSIVVIFLYEAFNTTKKTDIFYENKIENILSIGEIKKVIFLDLLNSLDKKYTIYKNQDGYSVLSLQSTNSYHNPFYNNITYLVSKEKNLIRIESLRSFDKKKLDDAFFDDAYIDVLDNNISKFEISKKSDSLFFYLLKNKKEKILFSY